MRALTVGEEEEDEEGEEGDSYQGDEASKIVAPQSGQYCTRRKTDRMFLECSRRTNEVELP